MEVFLNSNNSRTLITTALAPGDTTIVLAVGTGASFPQPVFGESYFIGTLSNAPNTLTEVVKVTERSGDTLTVVRAQEGTAAMNWPVSSAFSQLWTEGQAQRALQWADGSLFAEVEVEIDGIVDLSAYAYGPLTIVAKLMADTNIELTDITGLTGSRTVILVIDEDSHPISIPLATAPFFLSNISGDDGFPGYPNSTITLLYVPDAATYKWLETSRMWRTD